MTALLHYLVMRYAAYFVTCCAEKVDSDPTLFSVR